VAVVVVVNPVAIGVEVIETRDVSRRKVLRAERASVRVVVKRIVQISVIVLITPIVPARISVSIVVVDYAACLARREPRDQSLSSGSSQKSKDLSLAYVAGSFLSDDLRETAQHGDDRVVAVHSDLIETRLLKIDCTARCGDLIKLIRSKLADLKESRTATKRELSPAVLERKHIQ
jgi:hypothetical protein